MTVPPNLSVSPPDTPWGLAARLASLHTLTVGELQETYRDVFGVPSRSYNKPHLRKRIAYQWQVNAQGGLSDRARQRLAVLQGDPALVDAPFRDPAPRGSAPRASDRDPRLPAPGTTLQRVYRGTTYDVVVLEAGFRYEGRRYANLSRIAREITGTRWNGFAFFGLARRSPRRSVSGRGKGSR